jgi:hypothetical protein
LKNHVALVRPKAGSARAWNAAGVKSISPRLQATHRSTICTWMDILPCVTVAVNGTWHCALESQFSMPSPPTLTNAVPAIAVTNVPNRLIILRPGLKGPQRGLLKLALGVRTQREDRTHRLCAADAPGQASNIVMDTAAVNDVSLYVSPHAPNP